MHIAIGSDHAGFEYKEGLKLYLMECGHIVHDFGTESADPVDYPLFIRPVAEAVAIGEFDRGIVLGGSGNGEAIVANRVRGVRCALCWNLKTARWAREHNKANVLSLGQRLISFEEARAIVDVWLETKFAGGRHSRRIRMIDRPSPNDPEPATNGVTLQRTDSFVETSFVCNSCREEFLFPVDISEGLEQQLLEECPVCCHENVIIVRFDGDGTVAVKGDLHITG